MLKYRSYSEQRYQHVVINPISFVIGKLAICNTSKNGLSHGVIRHAWIGILENDLLCIMNTVPGTAENSVSGSQNVSITFSSITNHGVL